MKKAALSLARRESLSSGQFAVPQTGVGKAASARTFSAFVDEMLKIAVAPPSIRQALTAGSEFSANALKRKTFKNPIPTLGGGAKSVLPQAQSAAKSVVPAAGTNIAGVNIRPPTTIDPKMPLVRGTPPASPVHVAPQVNPQAAQIQQGAPQTVNSAVPTAGGAGVQQGTSTPGAPSAGQSGQGARR